MNRSDFAILKYSILIQRALLNVNIVNILYFCTLTFPSNTNMNCSRFANSSVQHSNSVGLF
jgi:hypothetical protein